MQAFQNSLRSLALLYELGFDRVVAPLLIAAGLAAAAHFGLGTGTLETPGNLFFF